MLKFDEYIEEANKDSEKSYLDLLSSISGYRIEQYYKEKLQDLLLKYSSSRTYDSMDIEVKKLFCLTLSYIDSILKYKEKNRDVIVVVASKRFYLLFNYLASAFRASALDMSRVISYKYFKKDIYMEQLSDSRYLIIDDAITDGESNITAVVNKLSKYGNKLMLYPLQREIGFKNDKAYMRKISEVGYYKRSSINEIAEFRKITIELFKDANIPNEISLPIMSPKSVFDTRSNGEGYLQNIYTIPKKKYDKMRNSNHSWIYLNYDMKVSHNEVQEWGFFFYADKQVTFHKKYGSFINSIQIRVQSKYIEKKKEYKVSFMPEVTLKQVSFKVLMNLVRDLHIPGSEYKRGIAEYISESELPLNDEDVIKDIYTSLYAAVVYRLSLLGWKLFEEKLLYRYIGLDIEWEISNIIRGVWGESYLLETESWYKELDEALLDTEYKLFDVLDNVYFKETLKKENKNNKKYNKFELNSNRKWVNYTTASIQLQETLLGLNSGIGWGLDSDLGGLDMPPDEHYDMLEVIDKDEETVTFDLISYLEGKFQTGYDYGNWFQYVRLLSLYKDNDIIEDEVVYEAPYVRHTYKIGVNIDTVFFYDIGWVYSGVVAFYDTVMALVKKKYEDIQLTEEEIQKKVQKVYDDNIIKVLAQIFKFRQENPIFKSLVSDKSMRKSHYYFSRYCYRVEELNKHLENKRYMLNKESSKVIYNHMYMRKV